MSTATTKQDASSSFNTSANSPQTKEAPQAKSNVRYDEKLGYHVVVDRSIKAPTRKYLELFHSF